MNNSHPLNETPLLISCGGEQLCGIIHHGRAPLGVVMLVGGPQYRVGSHRAYVLMARSLASAETPVLRFDFQGMGDSTGEFSGFTHLDGEIRAAVDAFFKQCPSLERVVLWGLCDGASAAALYASGDHRVTGLILANPWVRTETSLAKTELNDYYKKFISRGFWLKLLTFKLDARGAIGGVFTNLRQVVGAKQQSSEPQDNSLPEQMLAALSRFNGDTLLILCDEDMTAQEFNIVVNSTPAWQSWVSQPSVHSQSVTEADHTFSSATWREELNQLTREWLLSQK